MVGMGWLQRMFKAKKPPDDQANQVEWVLLGTATTLDRIFERVPEGEQSSSIAESERFSSRESSIAVILPKTDLPSVAATLPETDLPSIAEISPETGLPSIAVILPESDLPPNQTSRIATSPIQSPTLPARTPRITTPPIQASAKDARRKDNRGRARAYRKLIHAKMDMRPIIKAPIHSKM